jgi:undecaprenyl-diphosphatase
MKRLLPRMKALWRAEIRLLVSIFIVGGLLLVFGFIVDKVMEGSTSSFDSYVVLAFRGGPENADGPLGPPWVREMARDITALGSFIVLGMMTLAVAAYLLLTGGRAAALLVVVAVSGGMALNSLLKIQFARPRPDLFVPAAKVFTASFPSGHAALSAITYLTLAALLARMTISRRLRYYFMAVAVTLTCLIGASRVYLGVHYPTDILAGWCIGSAWALVCWAIMTRLQHQGEVEAPRTPRLPD